MLITSFHFRSPHPTAHLTYFTTMVMTMCLKLFERDIVVYWYSFSNPYTSVHLLGSSLVLKSLVTPL